MNQMNLSRIMCVPRFVRIMAMSEKKSSSYKAGYVAVVGKANVGKSSIVNAFMGQKIAAVTSKAQTTRRRQLGILTNDIAQIIFVDTPGLHQERNKLGKLMNQEVIHSLADADLIMFVIDASQSIRMDDEKLAKAIQDQIKNVAVFVVLNKSDLADDTQINKSKESVEKLLPNGETFIVSAMTSSGIEDLKSKIIKQLPESPPFYDSEQVTDLYERQIAADLIRESALNALRDEIPHGIAVRIDEYLERGEKGARIEATLFVERDSHKAIVIGQGGEMVKQIGIAARHEIEDMSSRKVFLQLRVKVRKNWRNDEKMLNRFGYRHDK